MTTCDWKKLRNVVFLYDLGITLENSFARVDAGPAPDVVRINTMVKWLSLCTLRILKRVANSEENQPKSLHWGFKFFDSTEDKLGVHCRNFRPFTSASFEEFEEALALKFQNSRRKTSFGGDSQTRKKSAPSARLQKALHEILADFSWETNTSVTKPPKASQNAVFLVTQVPHDSNLAEYCNLPRNSSGSITANAFKHSLLPLKLYQKFAHDYSIHLHIIDSQSSSSHNYQVVQTSIGKLRSSILPLIALVPEISHPSLFCLPFPLSQTASTSCHSCRTHIVSSKMYLSLKSVEKNIFFTVGCVQCGFQPVDKKGEDIPGDILGVTSTHSIPLQSHGEDCLSLKPSQNFPEWEKVLQELHLQNAVLVVKWRDKAYVLFPVQGAQGMMALMKNVVSHKFPTISPTALTCSVSLATYGGNTLRPGLQKYLAKPEAQLNSTEEGLLKALKQRYAISALSRQKTALSLPPPRQILRRRKSNESLMSSISRVASETGSGCSKASKTTAGMVQSRGSAMLQKSMEARNRGQQETKEKEKKEQEVAEMKECLRVQQKQHWSQTIQQRIDSYEQTVASVELERFYEGLLQIKESFVLKDEAEMQAWDIASLVQGLVGCILRRTKQMDQGLGFLLEKLTLAPSVIKQRDWQPGFKLREYQFQILFTLDLLWTFPSKDNSDAVDNISTCLRVFCSQSSAQLMKGFLEQTVVEYYGENMPSVIKAIYEEINVVVPPHLLDPAEQRSEYFPKTESTAIQTQTATVPEPKVTQKLGRQNSLNVAKQKLVPLVKKRFTQDPPAKEPEKQPKSVKRNLFDQAVSTPVKKGTPRKNNRTPRKRTNETPQKASASKTPQLNSDLLTPRKSSRLVNKLFTPCRTGLVLAPETPETKRPAQAEGVTCIEESPDVKFSGSRTPRGTSKMVRHGTSSFYMQNNSNCSQTILRSSSQFFSDFATTKASAHELQTTQTDVCSQLELPNPSRRKLLSETVPSGTETVSVTSPLAKEVPEVKRFSLSSPIVFQLGTPSKDVSLPSVSTTPVKTPRRKVRRALLDFDEPRPFLPASALTSPNSSAWGERKISVSSITTEENVSVFQEEAKKRKWEEMEQCSSQHNGTGSEHHAPFSPKSTPVREVRFPKPSVDSSFCRTPRNGSLSSTDTRFVKTKYPFTPPSTASLLKLQFAALADTDKAEVT